MSPIRWVNTASVGAVAEHWELNKVVAQLCYLVIVKVMFLSKDFERNKFSSWSKD